MTRTSRHDRRTRRVVAVTLPIGAGLLGASLSAAPGSRRFYGLTLATAGTWVAGGALSRALTGGEASRGTTLRRLASPVATALGAFGVFCAGGLVARRIPPLSRAVDNALDLAEGGDLPLVLLTTAANGIGEEIFFRGAVFSAFAGERPVVASTAAYTLTTVATRNPSLMLAAGVMGTLFAHQRRATGGVVAPTVTHLTWSLLMVTVLPRVLRRPGAAP